MRSLDKELLIVGVIGGVCFTVYLAWRRAQGVPAPAPSSVVAPIHAVAATAARPVATLAAKLVAREPDLASRAPSAVLAPFTEKGALAPASIRSIPLA